MAKNMVGINVTKGQDTSKILFFMYDITYITHIDMCVCMYTLYFGIRTTL